MESLPGRKGEGRLHTLIRAFRPIFIWAVAGGLLLTWDGYRRAHLIFRVSADGQPLARGASVLVDGSSYFSGAKITPGGRTLEITAPDVEPIATNVFVWLGRNDLGEFKLTRSTGTLRVRCDPGADKIEVAGERSTGESKGASVEFAPLPVGQYEVRASIGGWKGVQSGKVERNKTLDVSFNPDIGWFEVVSRPAAARVELHSTDGKNRGFTGEATERAQLVGSGSYKLLVSRGDYRKELDVEVKRATTNRFEVAFEYGELKLSTEPAGAVIFLNDRESGRTPQTLSEVRPGKHRVILRRDGYLPVSTDVVVMTNQMATFSTNLVSVSFVDAIQRAKRLAQSSSSDYKQGLALVEEALRAKPDDAEAVELKERFEAKIAEAEAKRILQEKQVETDSRKRLAVQTYRTALATERDAKFAELQAWLVHTNLARMKDAFLRSIQKDPTQWVVKEESTLQGDMLMYRCSGKGFFGKLRRCAVLLVPAETDQLRFCARVEAIKRVQRVLEVFELPTQATAFT
ncbi:MAG: PEGA domain-containing protein [Pedosphaera sp.]|nr:PEGA domain-containing protein [Pedosphaera sp.]